MPPPVDAGPDATNVCLPVRFRPGVPMPWAMECNHPSEGRSCRFESDPRHSAKRGVANPPAGPRSIASDWIAVLAAIAQFGRALPWYGRGPRFDPGSWPHACVAHLEERLFRNQEVAGSTPATGSWGMLVSARTQGRTAKAVPVRHPQHLGPVAQWTEHWFPKPGVVGSIPTGATHGME